MKIEHSFTRAIGVGCLAVAAVLAPQVAQASAHLTATYAGTPYTFAAVCDPTQPVLFIRLALGNTGDTPTAEHEVTAHETAGLLTGDEKLGPISPGANVDVNLPVRLTTARRNILDNR
jgi:hypothetical protein